MGSFIFNIFVGGFVEVCLILIVFFYNKKKMFKLMVFIYDNLN